MKLRYFLRYSFCLACFLDLAYKFPYSLTSLLLKCYGVTKIISILPIVNNIKT